ncbi:Metallo-hydrolase/oxidoreductase [Trichoderma citrinoviride]|uniref:Metallo-hydrolase/oxidoreductase n=1 Tax=Trichoderma citrinoviride TaxID=58853 RepID=A0A2T4AYG9_9HYPO|nr:Metallo-hydrolase/oxidoreductase [Trichoderma citrinoviride]PTB62116.1 Metallo-hydrolase/oxidoreductase [Trichoderma citrinoviride]
MSSKAHLTLNPSSRAALLRSQAHAGTTPTSLPIKDVRTHPRASSTGKENASVFFIGNATTVLEWGDFRILTDPNFLHAGDHVHLGPGVTSQRRTNPAVDLDQLPSMDCILLSHYHEDHFDQLVEESLNRDFPIITTPHAKGCLTSSSKAEPFRAVHALDFFESILLECPTDTQTEAATPVIKVTGMPGKHVPPGPLSAINDLLKAVPPTNGWLLELGWLNVAAGNVKVDQNPPSDVKTGYRIYISGDTLFVDELRDIPKWLNGKPIDLMLVHLGGTTIPGASAPLVMVTMDAKQGIQLIHLIQPDVTIPIHFDDYDVFLSPLSDFQDKIEQEGLRDRVVYLNRGDQYRFTVRHDGD